MQAQLRLRSLPRWVALRLKVFTDRHRIRARDVFRRADADKSGAVSRKELKAALLSMGVPKLTKKELCNVFALADADGGGEIDYREFEDALKGKSKGDAVSFTAAKARRGRRRRGGGDEERPPLKAPMEGEAGLAKGGGMGWALAQCPEGYSVAEDQGR